LLSCTLLFFVISETAINVINPSGIEIIPGFCKGIGAESGGSPIISYIVGEKRIISNEDIIPTPIAQEIPFAVVFFQKSSINIAGKFADAAIANASPTRKLTF
jgi:hypothetical protein